ncbi:MAG: LytTR family DNA-binding domain-containing protein [Bacteroidia bacterium]|nr:LytTR family DNA-binding domain-containing protein [Bacteroidia bacterium]
MITSIAIDDEPLALELLTDYASRTDGLDLVKTYTNPLDALKYLKNFAVDLLFLDIQMPDISGINFYRLVQQNPMVIFTTAHSKYAVEGFNLNSIDYLLKPIEYNRFVQAVTKAKDYKEFLNRDSKNADKFIHVRSEYSLVKIPLKEIEYIESFDDFIKIHVIDSKPILTLMSLKAIMEILPSDQFMRVHRSFIIPLNHIKSVRNNRVQLINVEIPLGLRHKDEFIGWFKSNK